MRVALLCASGAPIPVCSPLDAYSGPDSRCALPHLDSAGRIVHVGVLVLVVESRHF